MGSVIYTRVAWATVSNWNGVINLHLFIPRQYLLLTCLYRHVDFNCLYYGDLSHTNAHEEVSAWMAGIPQ